MILRKGRNFFFNNGMYLVEFSIGRNFASSKVNKQIKTYNYGKQQISS